MNTMWAIRHIANTNSILRNIDENVHLFPHQREYTLKREENLSSTKYLFVREYNFVQ